MESQKTDDADDATLPKRMKRPTLCELHKCIANRQWDKVQHALALDASLAVRVDDSADEDCWVDMARRIWYETLDRQEVDVDDSTIHDDVELRRLFEQMHFSDKKDEEDDSPSMHLRYWVGNNGGNNTNSSESYILRRMTLLHSLCRMKFTADDSNHDANGVQNQDLKMAIQTAEMIISASHNESQPSTVNNYCPPMFFPPVSEGEDEDDARNGMRVGVLHTSVLTIPDKMGDTVLHELAFSGYNIELIKALFRGCSAPMNGDNDDRKPTVYDLLTASNDYGSTPLHFIAESYEIGDEEVLRYVLEQCPLVDFNHDRVHPTMVGDNEDNLPLHYATSNCVSPDGLEMLTALGDKRSTLIQNSRHRLPLDELIEWYHDNFDDFIEQEDSDSEESDDSDESELDSDIGSDDDSNDDEDSTSNESQLSSGLIRDKDEGNFDRVSSEISPQNDDSTGDITRSWIYSLNGLFLFDAHGNRYLCPSNSVDLIMMGMFTENQNFEESVIWKQMKILIDAAAAAILSLNQLDKKIDCENYSSMMQSNTLHAAVIAAKYGNFPAFSVVMSSPLEQNCLSERAARDCLGYLPLHWACGDISYLLNSSYSHQDKYEHQQNPSANEYDGLLRFNTSKLGMTLLQYILMLCPKAACIPTKVQGELPLHLYLQDKRALWNYISKKRLGQASDAGESPDTPMQTPWDEVKSLLTAYPEALSTPSSTSHLYPFQLAATASYSAFQEGDDDEDVERKNEIRLLSLENTYRLILEDPDVVYENFRTTA